MSTTTLEIKNNFSKIYRRVIQKKEPVVIFEKTEPEAVLIDYGTYNILLGLLDEIETKGRFLEAYQSTRQEPATSLKDLKTKYGLT